MTRECFGIEERMTNEEQSLTSQIKKRTEDLLCTSFSGIQVTTTDCRYLVLHNPERHVEDVLAIGQCLFQNIS